MATHTTVSCLGCSGWWMRLWITCAYQRSVEVLLLTWAHDSLWCCLTNLWFSLFWNCLTAWDCLTVLPCQLSQSTQDYRRNCNQSCTLTVYISCSVMVSGDERNRWPTGDRSGITFRCDMHVSWDPPKTYVIDFAWGCGPEYHCRPGHIRPSCL